MTPLRKCSSSVTGRARKPYFEMRLAASCSVRIYGDTYNVWLHDICNFCMRFSHHNIPDRDDAVQFVFRAPVHFLARNHIKIVWNIGAPVGLANFCKCLSCSQILFDVYIICGHQASGASFFKVSTDIDFFNTFRLLTLIGGEKCIQVFLGAPDAISPASRTGNLSIKAGKFSGLICCVKYLENSGSILPKTAAACTSGSLLKISIASSGFNCSSAKARSSDFSCFRSERYSSFLYKRPWTTGQSCSSSSFQCSLLFSGRGLDFFTLLFFCMETPSK